MDLVLLGGRILTMDGASRRAEALAVSGGKIVAVGANAEIAQMAGDATRVVRLNGRAVTPGFIDPHNHFSMTTFEPVSADLRTPPLATKRDALDAIAATAASTPTALDRFTEGRRAADDRTLVVARVTSDQTTAAAA